MSVLYPDINLNKVTEITEKMLKDRGIRGLIIDIDNTLAGQDSHEIESDVREWLEGIQKTFSVILVSNNFRERVEPFAKQVNLEFYAMALKPFPFWGIRKAAKRLGLKSKEIALVGDQIFTDVVGGNLFGATTIRVEPMFLTESKTVGIKRKLERIVMERYYKKKEES